MLEEAVESVLNQRYEPLEIIVVDDGSKEPLRAAELVRDPRISIITTAPKGVASARNTGIAAASGEFVAFLDSDDLWKPGKLERQIRAMETESNAGLCYTDEVWLKNGTWLNQRKSHRKWSGWIFPFCLPLCIVSFSSAVIPRRILDSVGCLNEQLPVCEDYEYWLRLTLRFSAVHLPEKLVVKRGGHQEQLSSRYWGIDRFRIQALVGILAKERLTEVQRELIVRQIQSKCEIVEYGAKKRGFTERGDYYHRIALWANSQLVFGESMDRVEFSR